MHWFAIKRTVKLGLKSLWMHALRSTLTMLGIVFGVSSVVAMLAIGQGASREAQNAIEKLGSTNLIIETIKPPEEKTDTGTVQTMRKYGLTYADAEAIHNTIPAVEVTVPIREIDQEMRFASRPPVAVKVIGTVPWYMEVSALRLIEGRFLSSTDLSYSLRVCVVDDEVARRLFAFDYPLEQDVKIQGNFYRVVGIVSHIADKESAAGLGAAATKSTEKAGGVAGNVYIPVTTARIRFSEINASFMQGGEV